MIPSNVGLSCKGCGAIVTESTPFSGPRMWFRHVWACKHPPTIECRECFGKRNPDNMKCPICKCSTEKT